MIYLQRTRFIPMHDSLHYKFNLFESFAKIITKFDILFAYFEQIQIKINIFL